MFTSYFFRPQLLVRKYNNHFMTTLSVQVRTSLGKQVRNIRRSGAVPGVIYGHGVSATPVAVNRVAFEKAYRQAGESTLLDLAIEGGTPVKALIQDVQLHPTTGAVRHVDFHQVRMDEMLEVDIPLKFLGEAPAVKELGGILVKNIDHLKVECLPQDLVHEIEVDLTSLAALNQSLHLTSLILPKGIRVLGLADEILVTITPPRSEAELAALKEKIEEDVTKVEKVEGEKGEAVAEDAGGEAPAAPAKGEKK